MKCNHVCKQCGKKEIGNWAAEMTMQLEKDQLCFSCNHWEELLDHKHESIRIDNKHYMVGKDTDTFKGFGGRKFKIKLLNGDLVETTNLWYQGEIPIHYREKLFNNAEFLNSNLV